MQNFPDRKERKKGFGVESENQTRKKNRRARGETERSRTRKDKGDRWLLGSDDRRHGKEEAGLLIRTDTTAVGEGCVLR